MFLELTRLEPTGGFLDMRRRLPGIMMVAALALALGGCQPVANDNVNANLNANVIANMNANVNANVNANMEARRAPTRDEYERDRDRYHREAKEGRRTIGTGVNDGWLWVKTRWELMTAEDLRDSTVDVDVENEVVTLTGTVRTQDQRKRAEAIARAVEGVKDVRNQLKVSAS